MSSPTLNAANKLREQVLSVPGTVLLSRAGYPDEIIRFEYIPPYLNDYKVKEKNHIHINLDWGPAQEIWQQTMREMFNTARRDRPIPQPKAVAADSHEDWSISAEEVPLVENGLSLAQTPATTIEKPAKIYKCQICGVTWDSVRALGAHERFAHKK